MVRSAVFFFMLAGIFFISSCKSRVYKVPQPLDAPEVQSIPEYLRGTYTVFGADNSFESNLYIEARGINFVGFDTKTFAKDRYFIDDGRYFIVDENKKKEVFDVKFNGDSLTCRYESNLSFMVDTNLVLKDLKDVLVFNISFDPKDIGWAPFFLFKVENLYEIYSIDDDLFQHFEKKSVKSIANNLSLADIQYFIRNKDLFLVKFGVLDQKNHTLTISEQD